MNALHTWMFIAASILIGLAAGVSANAQTQEFRVKVTTKVSPTSFLGVTPDRRVIGIVCGYSLVKSAMNLESTFSADVVFPNDTGLLPLTAYRDETVSRTVSPQKPAYRPLSQEDANTFCRDPAGEFVFQISDDSAKLAGKRSVQVQSFGVNRRQL